MRVRSASCRFFRFSRFFLFVSIAPLPKTARQTDNSLALCVAKSRVWFRKAAPHLATLGSCSWKAQGTRLQGRCGSMNWNAAPFEQRSSASERCRASRSAFSRASLCGPRRRRRRPPRDWRANSFARSISLDRWPSSLFL